MFAQKTMRWACSLKASYRSNGGLGGCAYFCILMRSFASHRLPQRWISNVCHQHISQTKGFSGLWTFQFCSQPDLDGEVWTSLNADHIKVCFDNFDFGKCLVSNKGRVETSMGVKTHGLGNSNGYLRVGIHGRTFKVHRLVYAAFNYSKLLTNNN